MTSNESTGQTPPLQIVLTNTSTTQTVNFSGVSADNPAYTMAMNCKTLAPGQTCNVTSASRPRARARINSRLSPCKTTTRAEIWCLDINGFGADSAIQVDDLTDPALNAQTLAQSLVGSGVTISNVTYTGSARAAGNFTSSTNILGFTSGIVLSTGSVRNVAGPNCVSGPAPAKR